MHGYFWPRGVQDMKLCTTSMTGQFLQQPNFAKYGGERQSREREREIDRENKHTRLDLILHSHDCNRGSAHSLWLRQVKEEEGGPAWPGLKDFQGWPAPAGRTSRRRERERERGEREREERPILETSRGRHQTDRSPCLPFEGAGWAAGLRRLKNRLQLSWGRGEGERRRKGEGERERERGGGRGEGGLTGPGTHTHTHMPHLRAFRFSVFLWFLFSCRFKKSFLMIFSCHELKTRIIRYW